MMPTPSTSEIVISVSNLIVNNYLPYLEYDVEKSDFDSWYQRLLTIEEEITSLLPSNIANFFPLRKEVYKLVVKDIFGVMPFSKEYILKKYRYQYEGLPYLVYPAKKAKYLIIFFTGFINYESYNRFSWFYDETETWSGETVYLFLNDINCNWYVGTNEEPRINTYVSIIENIISKYHLDKSNCFTVGASMGGYASILFSILCELKGAFAAHPQLSSRSANRYEKDNWKLKIAQTGNQFVELSDLVAKSNRLPVIYLEAGRHPADDYGIIELVNEINKKNSILVLERIESIKHETESPSLAKVNSFIDFCLNV